MAAQWKKTRKPRGGGVDVFARWGARVVVSQPEKAGGSAGGLWYGFDQSDVPTMCWCVCGGG